MAMADPPRAARAQLFGGVPLFMVEETVAKLMKHAPPYGFQFGRGASAFKEEELLLKRGRATLPAKRRFHSCAVVGSSGTLLSRSLGREIDAHSAVIRVNSAPVSRHYAPKAGRRTTWRVMASPHAASDYHFAEQARFPNETMLVVCDRPYVYSCQNVLYATPKPHMHGINPRFYAQVRRHTGKSVIPLTGVVAVAIAIRSCRSVDVYGLSTMTSPAACFYYWSCGQTDGLYHTRPGDSEFHDFRANAAALLQWNASGHIRVRV